MSEKLNFLFIITDQQRANHLSCYNENMVLKTPNIDRIAREGIKFTNFYCNNPICMPNRSTIYTGQYPSVHGVTTNGRNLPQEAKTFVELLRKDGYHTASFGKIHLNYFGSTHKKWNNPDSASQEFAQPKNYPRMTKFHPYFGLEEVKLVSGHGYLCSHPDYLTWFNSKPESKEVNKILRPKDTEEGFWKKMGRLIDFQESDVKLQVIKHKIPEKLYSSSFVKEMTVDFLKKFADGKISKKNFFAFCSFPDPHHPYSPPGKYFGMYNPDDIKLPKNFYDNHEKSPKFMRKHFNETENTDGTVKGLFPNPKDVTELEAKKVIAASYGMEKMIDDMVGDILKTLDETGLNKNTVIIYTTDHGELGGDHRFFFKGPFLYQALAKIPFLIKIPDGLKSQISDSLASSIDIPETILELAGIKIPGSMQGRSMVSILNEPKSTIKKDVLIEMDEEVMGEKTRTLITDDNWRITVYIKEENGGELYNLNEDPDEMNNLWNEESYSSKKSEIMLRLMKKMMKNQKSPISRDCQY